MILVVAVVVSGAVLGGALARRVSALMAGAIVAYAIPFEVYAWAVAVLWVGLGGLALVAARVDRAGRSAFLVAAAVMVGGAALVAIAIVAPPWRLVVGSSVVDPVVALQSAAALGAVALGLLALREVRQVRTVGQVGLDRIRRVSGVPPVCRRRRCHRDTGRWTGPDRGVAHAGSGGLSVLWAVLGVVAFVAGLRFRIDDLRRGGLLAPWRSRP